MRLVASIHSRRCPVMSEFVDTECHIEVYGPIGMTADDVSLLLEHSSAKVEESHMTHEQRKPDLS